MSPISGNKIKLHKLFADKFVMDNSHLVAACSFLNDSLCRINFSKICRINFFINLMNFMNSFVQDCLQHKVVFTATSIQPPRAIRATLLCIYRQLFLSFKIMSQSIVFHHIFISLPKRLQIFTYTV